MIISWKFEVNALRIDEDMTETMKLKKKEKK